LTDVSNELRRSARDADHRELYRRLGARSAMCVPLVAHGRVRGAMTFYVTESARPLRPRRPRARGGRRRPPAPSRSTTLASTARAQREIAERAQAETRLRGERGAAPARHRTRAHIGTWDWHVDSGEVRVDWPDAGAGMGDGARGFSGSIDDLLGNIHPDDRQAVQLSIARALADGSDCEIEARVLAADGGTRWIAVQGKAMKDEGGRPVRLIGVAMDVTERKRTAQRLAAQHATTRILAECASLEEASPRFLAALGASLGWVQAGVWRIDAAAGVLRFVDAWARAGVDVGDFESMSRTLTFARGVGLPGRVWASGEPVWIRDVVADSNFPRARPQRHALDLHAALGFPVRVRNEVVAVLEFFRPPHPAARRRASRDDRDGGDADRSVHRARRAVPQRAGGTRRGARGGAPRGVPRRRDGDALGVSRSRGDICAARAARRPVPRGLVHGRRARTRTGRSAGSRARTSIPPRRSGCASIALRRPPPPDHPFRALLRAGRPVLVPVVAEDPFAGLTEDRRRWRSRARSRSARS
jgi:PAS domain-containing protein